MNVMLVDDEPAILHELGEFLRGLNHTVMTARNGEEAIARLDRDPVEVIISDVRMPVLSGTGLLQYVSQRFPSVVVILMTGYQDLDSAVAAVRYGAYDFIRKPFKLAEIRIRLDNIAEKKRLEQRLKEEETRRRRAERLHSLGILAAGIMHEINNPNTAIIGNAQMLKEKYLARLAQDDLRPLIEETTGLSLVRALKLAESIGHAGRRIAAIVERTDGFFAGSHEDRQAVDLLACLERALTQQRPDLAAGINLLRETPEGPLPVLAMEEEVMQILTNLLVNAREALAGRGEGTITVRVTLESGEQPQVAINVCDDGPGVPVGDREHIWDPFFTTKMDRPGRGLGLYLARQLVINLGGNLTFAELPGGGTCFVVHLPAAIGLP